MRVQIFLLLSKPPPCGGGFPYARMFRPGKAAGALLQKLSDLALGIFCQGGEVHVGNIEAFQLIMERRHPIYSKTTEIWNSYMPEQEVYRAEANPDPIPYGRP